MRCHNHAWSAYRGGEESQSLSVDIVGMHAHVTIDIIHKIIILVYVCLYTAEEIIVLRVKKHGYMGGSWGV